MGLQKKLKTLVYFFLVSGVCCLNLISPISTVQAYSGNNSLTTGTTFLPTVSGTRLYYPKIIDDINGDGFSDLVFSSVSRALVYVVFGKASGWQSIQNPDTTSDIIFSGADIVSSAGDINNDGFNDLLLAANENTWLVYGRATGWPTTSTAITSFASATFTESRIVAGDYDGSVNDMSSAGDVNGDGFDDVLFGYPYMTESITSAITSFSYLVFGKATPFSGTIDLYTQANASWYGDTVDAGHTADTDWFGSNLGLVGDVNVDGFDDFLIGAPEDPAGGNDLGRSYLFYGKSTGWALGQSKSTSDVSFKGVVSNSRAGSTPASRGDVNGDGYDDIIIGGYGDQTNISYGGGAYIFFGPTTGFGADTLTTNANATYHGTGSSEYFGMNVSMAGDVNGDGLSDMVIGSGRTSFGDNRKGKTHLIYGKTSGWATGLASSATDARWEGEVLGDETTIANSSYGDLNGDGFDDIVTYTRYNDQGALNAGKIYVIFSDGSDAVDGTYKHFIRSGNPKPLKFPESSVDIDFSNVTSNNGYVQVVEHKNQKPAGFGKKALNRYWTLTGSGISNYSYKFFAKYNDAELAASGITESKLGIYYKSGSGWTYVNSTVDSASNRIYATSNVAHFSDWIIGEKPVSLSGSTNVLSGASDFEVTQEDITEEEVIIEEPVDSGQENELPVTNNTDEGEEKKDNSNSYGIYFCGAFGIAFLLAAIYLFSRLKKTNPTFSQPS